MFFSVEFLKILRSFKFEIIIWMVVFLGGWLSIKSFVFFINRFRWGRFVIFWCNVGVILGYGSWFGRGFLGFLRVGRLRFFLESIDVFFLI